MPGKQTSTRHVSTSMSLDTFLSEAEKCCQTLESKDAALLNAYRLFTSNMDVSPEQYRQISASVQEVGEVVEALCTLLSVPESLPRSVYAYHYRPLVTFQYMNGQIQAILSSLARMRQLRKTSSPQKDRLSLAINNKLRSLRQDLHEGLKHIRNLADQALLEEKRMNRPPSGQQQKPFVIPGISQMSRVRDKKRPRSSLYQAD